MKEQRENGKFLNWMSNYHFTDLINLKGDTQIFSHILRSIPQVHLSTPENEYEHFLQILE